MRSIKEHGPIAKAEAASTAGPEEFVGDDVSGQGGAGSPGSDGASPYRAGAREHADPPIRRSADPFPRPPVPCRLVM